MFGLAHAAFELSGGQEQIRERHARLKSSAPSSLVLSGRVREGVRLSIEERARP
mgnify:FL=1